MYLVLCHSRNALIFENKYLTVREDVIKTDAYFKEFGLAKKGSKPKIIIRDIGKNILWASSIVQAVGGNVIAVHP